MESSDTAISSGIMPHVHRGHDDRVRVLWLTKGLGPGGAERLLVSFAQIADHDRFDIRAAYLLPWKDHLVATLADLGVDARCISSGRLTELAWLRRLRSIVVDDAIDLVHVHSPLVGALARPALASLRRSRRPAMVTTEHNEWGSFHLLTRHLNRSTLGLGDATIAVSDKVRDTMPPRLRARAEVIEHGVDVEAIAARRAERSSARAELGIEDDVILVGTVANLRRGKDYPTLLLASRVVKDRGLPVRFLSIGQGPLETELAARRDRLGLGECFRFLGYQEDPIRFMAAFDVFALCSAHEGLPIALLEALALGLPPIVTPVGGVPQVVRDGVEARYVSVGDHTAIADAIEELVDPALRAQRSRAASARGRHYSMESAVQRQQELYRELVQSRS